VLKIDNIKELNGYTFQSFTFEVKENIVLINNLKDEIKIEITYTENKIIKLIDKIYNTLLLYQLFFKLILFILIIDTSTFE
jgi:hypothetical protein